MPNYSIEDMAGYDIVGAEGGGERVVARAPNKIEFLQVGIPVTTVAAGTEVAVNVPVTKYFRARRLIIGGTGAARLRVASVKISSVDQFINNAPVPAQVFASDSIAAQLRGDTAQPGVGIDLRIVNPSTVDADLEGGFFGEAAT